jgi:(p)ppGpp synthase/HD superfamily hydrolase
MHDGQRRHADGAPFILHPLEVGALLRRTGAPDHVIAAGVLHDTLEKTSAELSELSVRFGSRTAALVLAVTENDRITGYARRKAALREQVAAAGPEALLVFAADKLSKVRELHLGATPPVSVRSRKLRHYRHCLVLLQHHLPDSPLVAALAAELERLPQPAPRDPALATAR